MAKINSRLDENGFEVPDDEPIEIPGGFKVPETIEQTINRLLKSHLNREPPTGEDDPDLPEEVMDFDVDNDTFQMLSPYEEVYDPVLKRSITYDEYVNNKEAYDRRRDAAWQNLMASDALRSSKRNDAPSSPPPAGGTEGGEKPQPPEAKKSAQ